MISRMSLLQISDPHFGTEQAPVVDALVRFSHEQRPEIVVLSGDITQRARRAQFRAARAFVDRVGAPTTLAIPGNHDIALFDLAARFLAPYANHCREFGAELEPAHETDRWLVITLNTTRPWRHKNGEVSPAQIERVAGRLERATERQLRVVVVHQPVAIALPVDESNLLRGHAQAVRRWSSAGCDLILGGHIHLPYVLPLHERYPDLPRKVWAVQAGTAVSRRLRHATCNSVNLIRVAASHAPRRCRIERWDYVIGARRFELAAEHNLVLAESDGR